MQGSATALGQLDIGNACRTGPVPTFILDQYKVDGFVGDFEYFRTQAGPTPVHSVGAKYCNRKPHFESNFRHVPLHFI